MIKKTTPHYPTLSHPSLPHKVATHSEDEEMGKPRKGIATYIGQHSDQYCSTGRPIVLHPVTNTAPSSKL